MSRESADIAGMPADRVSHRRLDANTLRSAVSASFSEIRRSCGFLSAERPIDERTGLTDGTPCETRTRARYCVAMSRENVKVVEAAYAALDRRDLDAFLSVIHPDVEFRSLIAEAEGQTYRGHDGVREWWAAVAESLGGLRYEQDNAEGFRDRGIVRVRIVGTVEGVEVPQTMWQAWRVRDGLICWWDGFRTEGEALTAAGLSE